jgi:hypothetical protein
MLRLTDHTKQKLQTFTNRLSTSRQHIRTINQLVDSRILVGVETQIYWLARAQSALQGITNKVTKQLQLIDAAPVPKEDGQVALLRQDFKTI